MRTSGATPNKKAKKLDTAAFIKEVADRMFLPEETVLAVWETSAAVITEALVRDEKVVIKRFGMFRLSSRKTARFRASAGLRQFIKENTMDKYSVEMNNEAVLMAKITGECPTCKHQLDSKDPPHCPNCGTAPFEKVAKEPGSFYGRK